MGNCGTGRINNLSSYLTQKTKKANDIIWLSHVICEWVWELDGIYFLEECKDKSYKELGGDLRNVRDILYLMKKYRKSKGRPMCSESERKKLEQVMKFRKNRGNSRFEVLNYFHIVHGNCFEYIIPRITYSLETRY